MRCSIDPRILNAVPAEIARRRIVKMKADPKAFRENLLVDCNSRSIALSKVLDSWQREDYEALDPAWQRIAGKAQADCIARAYLERPRGHSKTTDLAVQLLWVLYASDRKISGVAAAASRDQAQELREQANIILRLNPWLAEEITAHKYEIVNSRTESGLRILASDADTTMGKTPDFVIVDELTHWKNRRLWDSIFSAAAKRPNCLLVVIANAGFGQGVSWQWETREACRTDQDWYFHRLDGPQASWITEKSLAEQRRILTPQAYKRLWLNQWLTETGDALDMEDVGRCIVLSARPSDNRGCTFAIGGLDLGIKHDHAGFVVIGGDIARRKLVLLEAVRWDPALFPDHRISIKAVEDDVLTICQRRGVLGLAYDPWQCERTAEEFREKGIRTFRYDFNSKTQDEMATCLLDVVRNSDIELYPDASLLRDLSRLSIVEKRLGHKLEAPRDESGHCDLATAFVIALPWAVGTMKDYAPG